MIEVIDLRVDILYPLFQTAMRYTWSAGVTLVSLTHGILAESVTKCANTGLDSYYNSTTLPYVCQLDQADP